MGCYARANMFRNADYRQTMGNSREQHVVIVYICVGGWLHKQ